MIKKEFYKNRNDGVNLYKTYSSEKNKIKQNETENIFSEAIDIENAPYTYKETDIKIEEEPITEDIVEEIWNEVMLNEFK